YLLRRPPRAPVLLALAFRPQPAAATLVGLLERAVAVEPRPLTGEQADALLGDAVPAARRAELYRLCGGNPFYLDQLARAELLPVGESGSSGAACGFVDAVPTGLPRPVAVALARELDGLSARARRTIRAAAVSGEQFDPVLAAAVAGISVDDALAGIDELAERDLVRPTEVPTRFRFRHPILHAAAYGELGPGSRVLAHGRAAEVLAARGALPTARAHHVERSAQPGDERAAAVLAEAGQAASTYAPASAAAWFAAALRLLPAADADRRRALLVPMAGALAASGRIERGRDALREALAGTAPDDPSRVDLVASCASLEYLLRRPPQARALLHEELARLPGRAVAPRAALEIELAALAVWGDDRGAALPTAHAAMTSAAAAGEPTLVCAATALGALGHLAVGDVAAGEVLATAATRAVDGLTDDALAVRTVALAWAAWAELSLERLPECLRLTERGRTMARSRGQDHLLGHLLLTEASALIFQGRLTEARARCDEGVDLATLGGNTEFATWFHTMICWIAAATGDRDELAAAGERATAMAGEVGDTVAFMARATRGVGQVEFGEPDRGRAEILEAGGGPDLPAVTEPWRPHWYGALASAELALGDTAAADAWANRAETAAAGLRLAGRTAW
ncbi:MAG: hypothetical protein L0H84_22540, partial [Pseudonocardia sp.]|nr:hypothetical protein [Pseudonocardia sp.]